MTYDAICLIDPAPDNWETLSEYEIWATCATKKEAIARAKIMLEYNPGAIKSWVEKAFYAKKDDRDPTYETVWERVKS